MKPDDRTVPPREMATLRKRLLRWYRRIRRPLPWRSNRDPYAVWISEIMLQQTTVQTVMPFYTGFLRAFPTVTDLARAPVDSVLARWSGLGYYSRARNLHAAAIRILRDHSGVFPRNVVEARALPGIGPYTAAAVLSIAYGEPHAVLDGNVARVLSRFCAVGGPIKSAGVRARLGRAAQDLLDPDSPGDFNQAMMELGALVCTPRSPRCGECPLSGGCAALKRDLVHQFPEAAPAVPARRETLAVVVFRRGGRILFRRRPAAAGLMPGLWELPNCLVDDGGRPPAELGREVEKYLRAEMHRSARVRNYLGEARHAIMNRRIRLLVFRGDLEARSRLSGEPRWVLPGETATLGTSSIVRKSLSIAATAAEDFPSRHGS